MDGTNTTLNSGRILINLKPHDLRTSSITAVMQRLKQRAASLPGITLYMQPVQDLTIEGTVSRTQYQFVLQDADPAQLTEWTPKLIDRLNTLPQLADVTSDISAQGLAVFVDIDRDQAARFGITPATIDNALYDSYGQRIVSTIFTTQTSIASSWKHDPSLQTSLQSLSSDLPSLLGRRRAGTALAWSRGFGKKPRRCRSPISDSSCNHDLVQPRSRRVAGRGGDRDQTGAGRCRTCRPA